MTEKAMNSRPLEYILCKKIKYTFTSLRKVFFYKFPIDGKWRMYRKFSNKLIFLYECSFTYISSKNGLSIDDLPLNYFMNEKYIKGIFLGTST